MVDPTLLAPLCMANFDYALPTNRIALHPPYHRGESKLLAWRQGIISHCAFSDLDTLLPPHALLAFNDTKVIPARLRFRKSTGAQIETLLLAPADAQALTHDVMNVQNSCVWRCSIGNIKRWKSDHYLIKSNDSIELRATLLNRCAGIVSFSWSPGELRFSEALQALGETPLPPYLHRPADEADRDRYQTVYARCEGGIAAPTAGLHFTPPLLDRLRVRGVGTTFVTLHVGAGTFQPVKEADAWNHSMHAEQIVMRKEAIGALLQSGKTTVAVGTTALRALESLYWYGAARMADPSANFDIAQMTPYLCRATSLPPPSEALQAAYESVPDGGMLAGRSAILIAPGYPFQVCNGLITNFHLPKSTLILLVAALVGVSWRAIYDEALRRDYRFLSYGDSSLLIP